MCVCVHTFAHTCPCIYALGPPEQPTPRPGGVKSLKMQYVCLKISELWRLPHLWMGVQVSGWLTGLVDWLNGGVMSNH